MKFFDGTITSLILFSVLEFELSLFLKPEKKNGQEKQIAKPKKEYGHFGWIRNQSINLGSIGQGKICFISSVQLWKDNSVYRENKSGVLLSSRTKALGAKKICE